MDEPVASNHAYSIILTNATIASASATSVTIAIAITSLVITVAATTATELKVSDPN